MRVASAIVVTIAALALTLYVFFQQGAALVRGEPSWELAAITDARATPEVEAKTRRLLEQQPLDQAKLNLLFATEVKKGIAPERRALFRKTLYDMGWRNTPTQQNLIVEAGLANDPSAAILHIDALLRRGKLTDEIVPVLIQIEAVPQATPLLAARLEKHPPWRERYLASPISDAASMESRGRLLREMLDDGDTLSHAEIKSSLDAMIRNGFSRQAVEIALRASPGKSDGALIYDSDFSRYLALSARDRNNPLPFEWDTRTRPGASSQIVQRGNSGQLRIRWSGNGAPIVARTMTFMDAGQQARLEVTVDSIDALNGLQKFRFYLVCQGKPAIAFRVNESASTKDVVRYDADSESDCDLPNLVMRGHPQGRNRPTETSIDAIRLLAL